MLPFDATGGSKEDEQLADLLATELINRLSQIPTLRVISRGAVAWLPDRAVVLRRDEFGTSVGNSAACAPCWRVQRATHRRQTENRQPSCLTPSPKRDCGAKPTTARGGTSLRFRAEVAEQIAWALKSRIATAERQRQQPTTTDNLTAYDLYQRAIKLDKANPEQRVLLERAVELDPKFAEAFVSLAENHWKEYARKMAAGQQLENLDEFDKAVSLARQAVALDPECINCLVELSALINRQGKVDEGSELIRRALRLSPNSPDANETAGYQARLEGRYDEGYAFTRRVSFLWSV